MRCLIVASLAFIMITSLVMGQYGEECHWECRSDYCDHYEYDYCDYDCYEVCYPYRSFRPSAQVDVKSSRPSPLEAPRISNSVKHTRMRLYRGDNVRHPSHSHRSIVANPLQPRFSFFEGCVRK